MKPTETGEDRRIRARSADEMFGYGGLNEQVDRATSMPIWTKRYG